MASEGKVEFDATMEWIWATIAETREIIDEIRDEPRERHLHLVPAIEERDDG
jgi:hypothetical protein